MDHGLADTHLTLLVKAYPCGYTPVLSIQRPWIQFLDGAA